MLQIELHIYDRKSRLYERSTVYSAGQSTKVKSSSHVPRT
jgi:hypothetical protein